MKIDRHLSKSPPIDKYVSFRLSGDGVHGVRGTNTLARTRRDDGKPDPTYVSIWETPHYRQSVAPQLWEKTPGWYTVFVPFGSGTNSAGGKVEISFVGTPQCEVKDVSLQKLKP